MILQDSPAGCGPASIVNALEALGISEDQKRVWEKAKTNGTEGTSERGVIRALTGLGHRAVPIHEADPGIALVMLRGFLNHGCPVILLVDDAQHWACAVGTLGNRVVVVDSADGGMVQCLEQDGLLGRWIQAGEKRPFYGIAVVGKK